jgi:hypothetical protein
MQTLYEFKEVLCLSTFYALDDCESYVEGSYLLYVAVSPLELSPSCLWNEEIRKLRDDSKEAHLK